MNRKYRRQLELGIVALAATSLMLLWLVIAIGFWQIAQSQDVTSRVTPAPLSSATPYPYTPGPDISHCFAPDEERDLWDCIRHKRTDL